MCSHNTHSISLHFILLLIYFPIKILLSIFKSRSRKLCAMHKHTDIYTFDTNVMKMRKMRIPSKSVGNVMLHWDISICDESKGMPSSSFSSWGLLFYIKSLFYSLIPRAPFLVLLFIHRFLAVQLLVFPRILIFRD